MQAGRRTRLTDEGSLSARVNTKLSDCGGDFKNNTRRTCFTHIHTLASFRITRVGIFLEFIIFLDFSGSTRCTHTPRRRFDALRADQMQKNDEKPQNDCTPCMGLADREPLHSHSVYSATEQEAADPTRTLHTLKAFVWIRRRAVRSCTRRPIHPHSHNQEASRSDLTWTLDGSGRRNRRASDKDLLGVLHCGKEPSWGAFRDTTARAARPRLVLSGISGLASDDGTDLAVATRQTQRPGENLILQADTGQTQAQTLAAGGRVRGARNCTARAPNLLDNSSLSGLGLRFPARGFSHKIRSQTKRDGPQAAARTGTHTRISRIQQRRRTRRRTMRTRGKILARSRKTF